MKFSFTVNTGINLGTSATVRLIEGVRLIQVSLYIFLSIYTKGLVLGSNLSYHWALAVGWVNL